MFPPFHAPQNETEFNAFVTSLENSRQASLDMPITFPSALRPLRECVNPEPPVGSELLLPETCRIPEIFLPDFRPRFLPESRPLNDTTLVVTEPLLIGVNQLSQTYHGRVNRRGYESVEVVVKLFQQSLFRYPYLEDSFDRFSQSDWISATELAQREAWAYDKMIVLQGTTIPHSYGFYMFSIPSGEEVVGHVMERIGGLETTAYLQKNAKNEDAVWALADATAWALHAIHCAGVVHYDMSHRNMRVLPAGSLLKSVSVSVVLFDFALASQVIDEYDNCCLERDCIDLDRNLIAAGAPAAVVGVWRNTRAKEPPEWKSMIPFLWRFLAAKETIIKK